MTESIATIPLPDSNNDPIQQKIEEFIRLIFLAAESWVKAGRLYVELIETDPSVVEKILNHPSHSVTRAMLSMFERLGRNQMILRWAISVSEGAKRIRHLPMSEQEKYNTEPIPVLVEKVIENRVITDQLLIDVDNLTRQQAKQVFSCGDNRHVRSIEEQKAYLNDVIRGSIEQGFADNVIETFVEIINGHVVIQKPCRLSKRDIQRILELFD